MAVWVDSFTGEGFPTSGEDLRHRGDGVPAAGPSSRSPA